MAAPLDADDLRRVPLVIRCGCGCTHTLADVTRAPRFWDYGFVVLLAFDCACGSTLTIELPNPTVKDDLYGSDGEATEGRADLCGLVQVEDPFLGWRVGSDTCFALRA